MANVTNRWDRIPVWGAWSEKPGVPSKGDIEFFVGQRVRRQDGTMIYPEGTKLLKTIGDLEGHDKAIRTEVRDAMRAKVEADLGGDFDGSAWDTWWTDHVLPAAIFTSYWASDDDDLTPTGYQVRVTEKTTGGRTYFIEPVIADLDKAVPGVNLGEYDPPPSPQKPAPIYAKGQPGGIAGLDGDGDPVNSDGIKVGAVDPATVVMAVTNYLTNNPPAAGLDQSDVEAIVEQYLIDNPPAGGGGPGGEGREVELRAGATAIQWRYEDEASWTDLVQLEDLAGEPGADGDQIELRANATHVQWRRVGASSWSDLATLASLSGDDGLEVEMQTTATHVQWRLAGGSWADLVALEDLEGAAGPAWVPKSFVDEAAAMTAFSNSVVADGEIVIVDEL